VGTISPHKFANAAAVVVENSVELKQGKSGDTSSSLTGEAEKEVSSTGIEAAYCHETHTVSTGVGAGTYF